MRLFLAVHPGVQFAEALTTRLDPVRAGLPVAWTRPEHWHVTLNFLGNWPENRLSALQADLNMAGEQTEFEVSPGQIGTFPDLRRPRVLFLHMAGDGQLAKLAAVAREKVNRTWPGGPQDNKCFRGHLTLARIRGRLHHDELKVLSNMDLGTFDAFPVSGFSLVASELRQGGASHRILAFYPLRKKGE